MEEIHTTVLNETGFDYQDESYEYSISGNYSLSGFRYKEQNAKFDYWVTVYK